MSLPLLTGGIIRVSKNPENVTTVIDTGDYLYAFLSKNGILL